MASTQFRIEHDFLGEREVPANAYYGVQTLRGAENFPITGYRIHPALIRAMGIVKKSAALANRDTGHLEPRIADAIARAADDVIGGKLDEQFIVDPIQGGAGTSINMNANEVIANRALEVLGEPKGRYEIISPNTHVNMAQSTNDAFPTGVHIATLEMGKTLVQELRLLHEAFAAKEKEFTSIIKMGRTHLQDAVPIRLGQEFGAYRRVIGRDIERIRGVGLHLVQVNMGATAVGTGLNADPRYIDSVVKYLAEFSGLPIKSAEDLVDATQNTDSYCEISAALKVCMMNLSKIANDLRMMASGPRCGLNELNLPPRQPGSSIMPGKVNPSIPEMVNQVCFQVLGNDVTVMTSADAGQLELNVMMPVIAHNIVFSMMIITNASRVLAERCVEGIDADAAQCAYWLERSPALVTALAPKIGYAEAAKLAKEAVAKNVTVRQLVQEKGLLKGKELDEVLDLRAMTELGVPGERGERK